MIKHIFFSLFIFLPTLCEAASDDPCYPDQHPFNVEECDAITEISWDSGNSISEIPATGSGTIYILDGKPDFTYEVEGTNFYLDAAGTTIKEEEVVERQHQIYTINACGTGKVTVTDSCGNQAMGPISTDIALKWDEATEPLEEIAPNTSTPLGIDGGSPPYSYVVEGSGFSFDASGTVKNIENTTQQSVTLHTTNACGSATITVTDNCGGQIELTLRSTDGEWHQIYISNAGVNGDNGSLNTESFPGGCPAVFERQTNGSLSQEGIEGEYKVYQFLNIYCRKNGAYSTYEKALAGRLKQLSQCSWVNDYPKRLEGQCFTYEKRCMDDDEICNDYKNSDFISYDVGPHSSVDTTYWYYARTAWVFTVRTRIYRWVCD